LEKEGGGGEGIKEGRDRNVVVADGGL